MDKYKVVKWIKAHKVELAITAATTVAGAVIAKKAFTIPELSDLSAKDVFGQIDLPKPILSAGEVWDYWVQGGFLTANTTEIPVDKMAEVFSELMEHMSKTATGTKGFITMGVEMGDA